MAGQFIDITAKDGGTFQGYLALPPSGKGPGLMIMQEIFGVNLAMRTTADYFAEEGYVVLVPDMFWRIEPRIDLTYSEDDRKAAFDYYAKFDFAKAIEDMTATVDHLKSMAEVKGQGKGGATQVGVIGYCLGGALAYQAAAHAGVDCAAAYYGVAIEKQLDVADKIKCPVVFHFGGADSHVTQEAVEAIRTKFEGRDEILVNVYEGAEHGFANKIRTDVYHKSAAGMAHSRTIALLRGVMGPVYDLEHLWDMHCYYEFATRDVDATMATMVAEPYVNHVPTMTGGVGFTDLHRFYTNHFVNSNPDDTALIPVSRTVGADRIVDEMIFAFTHDREIDWLLPGVAPTGKRVEVPLVAIINFRGDKLYHEHIYWDQASVLVQIGLLDAKTLPVAGAETAKKLLDETLPSNELMEKWADSAPNKAAE
ncbi:MAG TPA: dienelactone hydrolase family protein [Alphaproteobacteria bacterium]|nr:dienelactone hydrolase family protein [Alphaproteobacteria bacterium]